ncbi:uncharacterized protein LOC122502934 [Leptopilina heterotoma]|uniref:uncharacterized protein LOC122502934 n=1 Tax=Leptopilina heterotoma TaxID=63436 RepID=UPI001CA81913|nr:uncharacterized protein LOC122502934 [Leptopilina heterotoma]
MLVLRSFLESEFIYVLLLMIHCSEQVLWQRQCSMEGNYKFCSLEQEEICHPLNRSIGMKIESFDSSAIIVRPYTMKITHSGKQCKFTIKTKQKEMGLFAVIQELNFRKWEDGQCKDYVKFKSKDKDWSDKWCGSINRVKKDFEVSNHYFSEYDSQGKLDTYIYISEEPIVNEELRLSIVYTPNIKCSKVDRKNFRQVTHEICIWKDYICDGYQNCAIEGCDDEKECVRSIENDGTGTKVTVGAVTTIFLCFILFVTCLWICKKHKKLCWSADCAGPTANRPTSTADNERTPAAPTAPMLQSSVSSGVQDKDLPPSYDSLFPQQSNTAIL